MQALDCRLVRRATDRPAGAGPTVLGGGHRATHRWLTIRLAGLGVVAIAACAASLASAAPDRPTGPSAPVPAAGVTQIVNGPSVALAPHTTGHQTVNCPVGMLALSGGAQSPGSNLHVWIVDSYPTAQGASWTASERNQSSTPATFNATVLCADPQPGYNIRSRPASIPPFEVVQAAAICHRSATHATGGGFRHARYGVGARSHPRRSMAASGGRSARTACDEPGPTSTFTSTRSASASTPSRSAAPMTSPTPPASEPKPTANAPQGQPSREAATTQIPASTPTRASRWQAAAPNRSPTPSTHSGSPPKTTTPPRGLSWSESASAGRSTETQPKV